MSPSKALDIQTTENTMELRFPSRLEHIDEACSLVSQYLQSKLPETHHFSLNLVMREGLTNAVIHGNKKDPLKSVRFFLDLTQPGRVDIEIEDQGKGFDWKKAQVKKQSVFQENGRGLFIIDTYFSNYRFNEKGNILYLQQQLHP